MRGMSKSTPNRDPRIDAYIAKSAEFARPILRHLREIVHEGCPGVVETLKWSMPSFEYKGILCGMAAFKQHCTFGFWKHALVVGDDGRSAGPGGKSATSAGASAKQAGKRAAKPIADKSADAMGQFGRITSVGELPARKHLLRLVKKAAALNDAGIKVVRPKRAAAKPPPVPADLAAGLKRNKTAGGHFEAFSPSKRREYIEWINEARTEPTRARRLATALEWIGEGKARNWKYERC